MFGKKKDKNIEENVVTEETEEAVETVATDVETNTVDDSSKSGKKSKKELSEEELKRRAKQNESIKKFFTNNISVIISVVVFIVLFIVGSKMQDYAKTKMQGANSYTVYANNRMQAAEYAESQARTAINRHIGGIDEQRHMKDDEKMLAWVQDAFTFNGFDEYTEHREEYVAQLGFSNPFVREIMPSIDIDISLMTELDYWNAQLNMHIDDFTSYVREIDEETGTYYYLAEVGVSSQNGKGRTSGSAGKPILLYCTVTDENGVTSIDLESFECYLPSDYYPTGIQ